MQRIEHYEIAAYGTDVALAKALGEGEVADLLTQTLEEEKQTDLKLTEVTEQHLMPEALGRGCAEDQPRAGSQDRRRREAPFRLSGSVGASGPSLALAAPAVPTSCAPAAGPCTMSRRLHQTRGAHLPQAMPPMAPAAAEAGSLHRGISHSIRKGSGRRRL